MKNIILTTLFALFFLPVLAIPALSVEKTIALGSQPQISTDNKGIIRVVFGREDKVFCVTSFDKGETFSKPILVATVPKMHLGMSRGPQLASSNNYSVITAQDQHGSIHWYQLSHSTNQWKSMGVVNDLKGAAPEGLMGIAADKEDNFYAVWLDTRVGGGNNIFFSSLANKSARWSKNRLVYRSPDKLVCGCCKPSIAVQGSEVAIMFRNWLNGSRDLYVTRSANNGKNFTEPQKMGLDTWKLNGCPMDGGGLRINPSNGIQTVWQRKGNIYYAQPGEPEIYITRGRTCSIAGTGANPVITYQTNDTLNVVAFPKKASQIIGRGGFLKSAPLNQKENIFVWEQDNLIKYKIL